MRFSSFLQSLLEKGQVTVASELIPFENEDLEYAITILKNYYEEDRPEFLHSAALWAGTYLYYAMQMAMLRNFDDNVINNLLQDYPGEISSESIYSVDLSLRHLPRLFDFVKGLAPDDILVQHLEKAAYDWPFSSIGIDFKAEINYEIILKHPSLSCAYIDRIIKYKDIKRVENKKIILLIEEALGNYADILWPEFLYLKNGKLSDC